MTRKLISSGTAWERKFGYSRAVQVDNLVVVAGTTAVDEHGRVVAPGHPGRQATSSTRRSRAPSSRQARPLPTSFASARSSSTFAAGKKSRRSRDASSELFGRRPRWSR